MSYLVFLSLLFFAFFFEINLPVSAQNTNSTPSQYCTAPDFQNYIQKYGFYEKTGQSYSYGDPTTEEYKAAFAQAKEVAIKQAPKQDVDPALAVWWVFFETGGKKDSYSYSNCGDSNNKVDYNCPSTRDGQWQLGYGQQFSKYRQLTQAFQESHGDPDDPQLTQRVGQEVFNKAGQNKTFPERSAANLVNSFNQSDGTDVTARYLLSVLMRDPNISMYLLASSLKGFHRDTAFRWGSYYSTNWQKSSNLMNDVLVAWNSTACTIGPSTVSQSGMITQTIKSNTFITRVGNPSGAAPGGNAPTIGGGPLGFTVSCPLDPQGGNFKISCGTAANPVGNCGHGHPQLYIQCIPGVYASCPFSEALKKSIDVVLASGNAANAPVYMPYLNGNQTASWVLVSGPIPINSGSWGWKAEYATEFNGKNLKLDLTHINPQVKSSVKSGEQVGSVYSGTDGSGRGHLHTLLYVDGKPVETEKEAFICSKESPTDLTP
jgi:hypothetical protein